MLVLSRRPGEEIIINDNIKITVVSIKGDRIRIGITAPSDVSVDRAEVHDRKTSFIDLHHGTGELAAHDTGVHLQTVILTKEQTLVDV